MTLRLEVVHDLAPVAAAWDDLVDRDGANPFLRSWWLMSTLAGRPRFALVMDGSDALVGGLALERVIRVVDQLRFVGEELGAADLDLLSDPDHEAGVVSVLERWLARRRGPARFRLSGLREGARVAALVPNGTVAREGIASSQRTPDSVDEYLATRSRNFRKDLYRTQRRVLGEHGARIEIVPTGDVPAALARFHDLHAHQFGERSLLLERRGAFDRAVLAGSAAGEVRVHVVSRDDRYAAVEVMLTYGRRLGLLASTFDEEDRAMSGSGNLLSLHAFEYAIEHGYDEVDFLRGASSYKTRWTDQVRPVMGASGHSGEVARLAGLLPGLARSLRFRLHR